MPYVVLTQIITLDPSSCIMFSLHREIKLFVSSQLIIRVHTRQHVEMVTRATISRLCHRAHEPSVINNYDQYNTYTTDPSTR